MDERKKKEKDTLSFVSQNIESTISAVYECKRLFYLILQNKNHFLSLANKAFEDRENKLIKKTNKTLKIAKKFLIKNKKNLLKNVLNNFSVKELNNGLKLVQNLSKIMDKKIRKTKSFYKGVKPRSFNQIW